MSWFSSLIVGVLLFQAPTFEHTQITFEIEHLGILKVNGTFDNVEGILTKVSSQKWSFKGSVDVTSINTNDPERDRTLLTEQYLNAGEYRTIPFNGHISMIGKPYSMTIEAQIRGLPIFLNIKLNDSQDGLVSEPFVIKRGEIGLDFGVMDSLIGDDIKIQINTGVFVEQFMSN